MKRKRKFLKIQQFFETITFKKKRIKGRQAFETINSKRKLVKIRQFTETIIVPGFLNIFIYFMILVACVWGGVKFSSPLQLGFIIIAVIVLTWEILFNFTQYLVTKFLTFNLEKTLEKLLTGIVVCFSLFLYALVTLLYILKDIFITIVLILITCFCWIFIFFSWIITRKKTRWLLYTCIFVF